MGVMTEHIKRWLQAAGNIWWSNKHGFIFISAEEATSVPLFTVSVSFCLVVIHKKVRTSEVSAAQLFLQPLCEGVWKGTECPKRDIRPNKTSRTFWILILIPVV